MLNDISQFHFIRPLWLLGIIPALLLCAALWRSLGTSQLWLKYISPQLLPFLLDRQLTQQNRWPLLGLLGCWVIAVVALAGPAWQKVPVPIEKSINALAICWDLSPSMLAEDVKPSRLLKSRLKIIDLLKAKSDGQAGLVAFSAEAYTVTPLTDDYQTIINLLPALSPTTLPSVGSNPEMALEQAAKLLEEAGIPQGQILMLTDEIAEDALDNVSEFLESTPHQVTIWGIGSTEGAPIPLPNGGFAKDSQGDIVVAKLNQQELQTLTSKTAAYYVPLVNGDTDVDTIVALTDPNSGLTNESDRKVEQWYEHGQYLVWLLIPFCLLLFRRGLVFTVFLAPLVLTTYSPPSSAMAWQDLWKTQDQQAEEALSQGDADAAMRFSTPQKRGSELYKQGRFEEAAEQFSQRDDAVQTYNRGTALIRAGQYDEAIHALEEALKARSPFPEAQKNLDIAQQLKELAKQQEQQDQQNDSEKQDSESDQDQQQDKNTQSDGDSQENDQASQQQNESSGQQSSSGGSTQDSNSEEEEPQQGSQNEQGSSDASAEDSNPFSTDQNNSSSASSENADAQQLTQSNQSSDSDEGSQSSAGAMAMQPTLTPDQQPMTEEEQMLEQWLRKVPDDPSGLMRNKFKHQYMQRRQQMGDQFSPQQRQAEKRW